MLATGWRLGLRFATTCCDRRHVAAHNCECRIAEAWRWGPCVDRATKDHRLLSEPLHFNDFAARQSDPSLGTILPTMRFVSES